MYNIRPLVIHRVNFKRVYRLRICKEITCTFWLVLLPLIAPLVFKILTGVSKETFMVMISEANCLALLSNHKYIGTQELKRI